MTIFLADSLFLCKFTAINYDNFTYMRLKHFCLSYLYRFSLKISYDNNN